MFTRPVLVCLVAVSVLLGAGCGSGKPKSASATSSPLTSSAASTLGQGDIAKRDALAAYAGMWQAMAKAGEVPDPEAPELRQYAADRALARIVSALFAYRESGVVTDGAPITNAQVTAVAPRDSPTEVRVSDCGDSSKWTKHKKATRELIKDDPRGRRKITAIVKPIDGSWKVVSFDVGDIGSC